MEVVPNELYEESKAKDAEIERLKTESEDFRQGFIRLGCENENLRENVRMRDDIIRRQHKEIKRLQALCDEWKVLAVEGYEPQIAKLQAVVDAAETIPYVQGVPGIAETHAALAALEGEK